MPPSDGGMMAEVLPPGHPPDPPRKQAHCFVLTKGDDRLVCELWSHPFGWELRLEDSRELLRSQVCRTFDEVFDIFGSWKEALQEQGWRSRLFSEGASDADGKA